MHGLRRWRWRYGWIRVLIILLLQEHVQLVYGHLQ
jgi:hypothetical protein